MASTSPILRQISWISLAPQLALFVAMVFVARFLGAGEPLLVAAAVYLAIFISLRWLVASGHRRGIAHFKKKEFEPAIDAFANSYAFFRKHAWIDRFRYLTLLSSSRISYREMALVNIAFCHSQVGDGRNAKEYYEKALEEFPDSEIAKSALRMIASAQDIPGR